MTFKSHFFSYCENISQLTPMCNAIDLKNDWNIHPWYISTDEEAQAAAVSNANGQVTTSSQTQNNKHLRVAMNNNSNPMIASTLNHIRSLSIRRKSNQAATAGNHGGGGSNGHHQPSSRKKSTDRTTRLLIVILVLFLITEFPQVSTFIKKTMPWGHQEALCAY